MQKIGAYVRRAFREGLVSESLIYNLQDAKWCKNNLLANIPVLIPMGADPVDSRGHRRYYSNQLFFGEYQLSSQWAQHQREAFNYMIGAQEEEEIEAIIPVVEAAVEVSSTSRVAHFAQTVEERDVREELMGLYYEQFIPKFSAKAGVVFETGRDMIDYFENNIPSWKFHSIDNARNAAAHRKPDSKNLMIIGIVMIKIAINELNLI